MAHPVLQFIHSHSSVRKYRSDPIPEETVRAIVSAAQRSSTSSNLQLYSVVAVTDRDLRVQLAKSCGNQEHIVQAPLFLAWCADLSRMDRVCALRGYEQVTNYVENFLVAAMDAAIAAQTAALAAESLGLGICYIGAIRNNPEEVIALLGLPRLTFPLSGMTVGWPDGRPAPKPRLPLDAVLHWERYDRTGEDVALIAYDRVMMASGIYRGRQVPGPSRRPEASTARLEGEEYGWLEHSARRASQASRTELRRVLEQQGFALG